LKFNGTNHYGIINNFTPTKEKGYTFVLTFALESDRQFHSNYKDYFISKRDSSGSYFILIYGVNKTLKFKTGAASGDLEIDLTPFFPLNKPTSIVFTIEYFDTYFVKKAFVNGY